jgi:hypothetical protein
MSMLCNCCVRELLILARTWFAFGLPSKTGCDSYACVVTWSFRIISLFALFVKSIPLE